MSWLAILGLVAAYLGIGFGVAVLAAASDQYVEGCVLSLVLLGWPVVLVVVPLIMLVSKADQLGNRLRRRWQLWQRRMW